MAMLCGGWLWDTNMSTVSPSKHWVDPENTEKNQALLSTSLKIKQTTAVHCGKFQGHGIIHRARARGSLEGHLRTLLPQVTMASLRTFPGKIQGLWRDDIWIIHLPKWLPPTQFHWAPTIVFHFNRTAWETHRNNKRRGTGEERRRNYKFGIPNSQIQASLCLFLSVTNSALLWYHPLASPSLLLLLTSLA